MHNVDLARSGFGFAVELLQDRLDGLHVTGGACHHDAVGPRVGGDGYRINGPAPRVSPRGRLQDDARQLARVGDLQRKDAHPAGDRRGLVELLDELGDLVHLRDRAGDDDTVAGDVGHHARRGLGAGRGGATIAAVAAVTRRRRAGSRGGLKQLVDHLGDFVGLGAAELEDAHLRHSGDNLDVEPLNHLLGHCELVGGAHEHHRVGPVVRGGVDDVLGVAFDGDASLVARGVDAPAGLGGRAEQAVDELRHVFRGGVLDCDGPDLHVRQRVDVDLLQQRVEAPDVVDAVGDDQTLALDQRGD